MATRSSSFTLITRLSVACAFLILTSCKSLNSKFRSNPANSSKPPATSGAGPIQVEEASSPQPQRGPARKVAVVLGPGGAKTFAEVGVLKALQQQRVPIDKVIGLEWGALIGGLFAHKGQAHDLEWKLYKMEQKNLPHPKGFFSRNEDSVKVMDDFLSDAFGKDDVKSAKIEFECPTRSLYSGVIAWQNRGPFKAAVRRCLPYPPVFKIQGSFLAGATQATEAIEQLQKQGYNLIILVNVLGSSLPVAQDKLLDQATSVILWQEVKLALSQASRLNVETINVDTSAYPVMQFEAKKDLVQLGEAAGGKAATSIINKYGF